MRFVKSRCLLLLGACALTFACDDGGAKPEAKSDAKPAAEAEAKPEAKAEAGALKIVSVPNDDADLGVVLAAEAKKATELSLTPHAELWADWCGPCKQLEGSLDDPRMKAAFASVYLIRIDTDHWGTQAGALGMDGSAIPAFFELDASGKATGRTITGGAWEDNIPENMAPPLTAYFQAKGS